jgi:AraC-like DNA-binding protein
MKPQLPPSFDTWTSIFLLIAVQGVFTGIIILLNRRGDRVANRYIAFILFLFSISMIEYVLYWSHYLPLYPIFINISISFPFLLGPLLFFYFRKLLLKRGFIKRDIVHLLPFFLDFIFWLPFYLARRPQQRGIFFQNYQTIIEAMTWVRIAHMAIYAFICLFLIKRYSGLKGIKVWSERVIFFFCGFIVSHIAYFTLIRYSFFSTEWDYAISLFMSGFIGLVAAYGYIQPEIFQGIPLSNYKELIAPLSISTEKYKSSSLTSQAAESLKARLDALMQQEKCYRDNDLNLEKLALRLGANRHQVSQVINEKMGVNFFDYINNLRVEEAKELLVKNGNTHLTIIDIAYTVGFNNKVTFNTTFKNKTGMTPSEFRAVQKSKFL